MRERERVVRTAEETSTCTSHRDLPIPAGASLREKETHTRGE
jgi:hypothetical protein